MLSILVIIGLGLNFLGAAILGLNAYSNSLGFWWGGSVKDRLQKPITAIIGLVIMAIGFALQFVAALLTFR